VPVQPDTPTATGVGIGEVDTPSFNYVYRDSRVAEAGLGEPGSPRPVWTLLDKRGDRIAVVGLEWARV
jgi:hypothetical protein